MIQKTLFNTLLFSTLLVTAFVVSFLCPQRLSAESLSSSTDGSYASGINQPGYYSNIRAESGFSDEATLNTLFVKNDNTADSDNASVLKGAGASAKDWSFSFAPYLWLVGIDGTMGANGQTADIDISFGDIWDNLDFAFQGHAEVIYRNKYGFFVDGTYVKISTKNVRGPLNIKATVKLSMWEFAGFYRFFEQPSGFKNSKGQTKPSFSADVLGGGRLMYMDNTINFGGRGPVGVSNQVSESETWFDFMVGARIKWQMLNRVFFTSRTDIGGFGFGFSSDFSWNFVGMFGVDATDWMQILLGYRVFYDDYSNGSGNNRFVYDAWMTGPMVGINFYY